jgi:hypothetical protein
MTSKIETTRRPLTLSMFRETKDRRLAAFGSDRTMHQTKRNIWRKLARHLKKEHCFSS